MAPNPALLLRHLTTSMVSDALLLDRFTRLGDQSAFAALVQRHGPMVLQVCRRVLSDPHAADDAFQGAFCVLARRAATIRNPGRLAAWLHGVAHRIALKARAARRRCFRQALSEADGLLDPRPDPLAEISTRETLFLLDEEIGQLPETYRLPVILCCLEGLTLDEAARQLGWTRDSVKGRLERGRKRLHERLVKRGLTLGAALATAEVFRGPATAGLVGMTVRTALAFAAGEGSVGPGIAALAQGGLETMTMTKTKIVLALVLATGLVTVSAGALMQLGPADKPPVAQTPAPAKLEDKSPRTDLYGDPLPQGALTRLGSLRLRHADLSDFVLLPDGKTAISAGGDWVLRFWDLASTRQVRAVRIKATAGPSNFFWNCFKFSPDGKVLVGQEGNTLVFWEVDSGKELQRLPGPGTRADGTIGFLLFSPDGKILAVDRGDRRVSLWDWKRRKELEIPFPLPSSGLIVPNMQKGGVGSFSPDGKWFIAGASAEQEHFWGVLLPLGVFEVATGREILHLLNCGSYQATVSPDSKRLAVSSERFNGKKEAVIRLFDLASGKEEAQFPQGHSDEYYSLAFSPNGTVLACGSSDRSCLLDLTTGRVLKHMPQLHHPVFTPDGKTLVTMDHESRLRVRDVATGKDRHDLPGDFGPYGPTRFSTLVLSPNGQLLATEDWIDKEVHLWDTTDGRLLHRLPLRRRQKKRLV